MDSVASRKTGAPCLHAYMSLTVCTPGMTSLQQADWHCSCGAAVLRVHLAGNPPRKDKCSNPTQT